MRRLALPVSILVVVLLALLAVGGQPGTTAREGTPTAAGHPLVGSWQIRFAFETQGGPPIQLTNLATFSSDGTLVVANGGQLPTLMTGAGLYLTEGHGAWEPTGERAADAAYVFILLDQSGGLASINTARIALEVDPSGDAYSGSFTLDMTTGEGTQFAPTARGTFTATRIRVEPMATPGAATPGAATPAMATPDAGSPAA